jgi:hypothetical protein
MESHRDTCRAYSSPSFPRRKTSSGNTNAECRSVDGNASAQLVEEVFNEHDVVLRLLRIRSLWKTNQQRNLFADQVARVFFVLEAVVPEEFGIGDQRMA